MLNEKDKYQDELANILNGLADSVLEMPDEEIKEELIEDGDDTEIVRQIMLNSVKNCRQKNLRAARERYDKNFFSFQATKFELPETPDEKRHLIQAMLGSIASQNQMQVTAQFRDFENLPDEDLDGVLQQIFALQETAKSNENE